MTTIWCPRHAPPPQRLPLVRWRVAATLRHPGRETDPTEAELEDRLPESCSLPTGPVQTAALAIQEESRWRVVLELRRLVAWLAMATTRRRFGPQSRPDAVIAAYMHEQVRALRAHPDPHRRVTRPTTPGGWLRRLAYGLPDHSRLLQARGALTTRLLAGYAALAPAPSTLVQRDVTAQWQAALDEAWEQFRRRQTRDHAALWLMLELARQGLRPRAAFRAVTTLGQRRQLTPTSKAPPVWELAVHVDKDNPLGRCPAVRRRWLPVVPLISTMMALLPVPVGDYNDLMELMRAALRRQGVRQVYAARRDAGASAEAAGHDAAALLNHRPGSRTTPVYTGTTTPTTLLQAMLQSSS